MKVLIIEDDSNKLKALSDFLTALGMVYDTSSSYHSGLRFLLKETYDWLLLDMSIPTYDVTAQESGGRVLALGGRDILFQLRRRKIPLRTIVFTQYEDFDGKSLTELDNELHLNFPQQYVGFVYYNITQDSWKDNLRIILNQDNH